MSWAASSFFASAAYIAQTGVNYAGNEAELEKRLAPLEIGKAAFNRASWGPLFVPMALDFAAEATGNDPIFAYQRSTGLSGAIMGVPSVDLAAKAYNTTVNAGRALTDDSFTATRDTARNAFGMMPFSNILGIRWGINNLVESMPKRNPLDYDQK